MKKKINVGRSSSGRMMHKFHQQKTHHHQHNAPYHKAKPNELIDKNTGHAPLLTNERARSALLLMAFVWQLQQSLAEKLYTFDTNYSIHYLIDYAKKEFPHLEQLLVEHCNALLFYDYPQANYTSIDSPHCLRRTGDPEPGISLSIASGHNISASFALCLNNAMLETCRAYYREYDNYQPDNKFILIVAGGFVLGLCACIGLISCLNCGNKNNEVTDQSEYVALSPHSSPLQTRATVAGRYDNQYNFYSLPSNQDETTDTAHHDNHHHAANNYDDVAVHWGPSHH